MEYNIIWKQQPVHVWISCSKVSTGVEWLRELNELLVQFEIDGERYTAFVPEQFVDVDKQQMEAQIVADCDDDLLVDIPVETLTSGLRFLVPAAERANVLVES